ncbi:MAG TPA: nucleotidyltransferase domain-containing protein [Polyangia bacterium]
MRVRDVPQRRSLTREELERVRRAAAAVFAAGEDVLAAYLFGSAARAEPAADVDVAVLFRDAPDPRRLDALAAELQRDAAPAGLDIDLRPLNGASPRFRANVVREGQVLFERDRLLRLEREAQWITMWLDFKPTWERMRRRMLARWDRG